MNLIRQAAIACCVVGSLAASAQTDGINNPMVQAVLKVYSDEIAANPSNAEAYLKRAEELYKFDQYLRALSDADRAIALLPSSDTEGLAHAYALRANIYQMLDKKEEALADLDKAVALDPSSYQNIYNRANVAYELGLYPRAKADYTRLRQLNSRSIEALVGLSRVAVQESNLGLANEYINDAVALAPQNSDVYVRRASVRQLLGNNIGAVDDLIIAISTDNNPTALKRIAELSNVDYSAVINSLSNAIQQAPNVGMFRYIRAMVAQSHYHFPAALADYQAIIDADYYNYPGIYSSMAECYLALCDFDKALQDATHAVAMTDDNAPYYVVLSRVLRASRRYDEALEAVDKALAKQPSSPEAMEQRALCLASLGRVDEAQSALGQLLLDSPDSPYLYMLRAWMAADLANQRSSALTFYRNMLSLDFDQDNPRSYRGFALLAIGQTDEAVDWMETILRQPDTDGFKHYLGACFYSLADRTDDAFDCMTFALQRGFASRYDWTLQTDAGLDPYAIRNLPKFEELLKKYSYIFE